MISSCGGGSAQALLARRAVLVWHRRFDAPLSPVRLGIALVLFAAAALKTHQLATEPIVGDGLLDSRPLLVLVVQYELLLAFWLASRLAPAASWCVALGTFAVFAVVAAGKGIAGEALCGCFGRVPTSSCSPGAAGAARPAVGRRAPGDSVPDHRMASGGPGAGHRRLSRRRER